METTLQIKSVGHDIVNDIYVARGSNFQFTIEKSDYMDWSFRLKQGETLVIERKDLICFDGVHIFE